MTVSGVLIHFNEQLLIGRALLQHILHMDHISAGVQLLARALMVNFVLRLHNAVDYLLHSQPSEELLLFWIILLLVILRKYDQLLARLLNHLLVKFARELARGTDVHLMETNIASDQKRQFTPQVLFINTHGRPVTKFNRRKLLCSGLLSVNISETNPQHQFHNDVKVLQVLCYLTRKRHRECLIRSLKLVVKTWKRCLWKNDLDRDVQSRGVYQ